MKFIYPAIVKKLDDDRYYARFPDLECCEAYGDSIDEVMDNANAAAYTWIETELEDDDAVLPRVSDFEDIALDEGEFLRNVCVTMRFFEGWDE
ncbi:MAG TPA: type II toxin-antitoxin system HicB family antitoxin [Candidatus Alectryocaccobium stercorigallinarum]|nr:type II toxin-antitoxin system HicB family antitoxin [Candidatus Alectryocaccobium stercorigallinarum]